MEKKIPATKGDSISLFVKTEGVELRGYNYVRAQIDKNHANEPVYTRLLEYSELVIADYIRKNSLINTSINNLENKSGVQLTFKSDGNLRYGDYLVRGDPKFDIILNSRAEYSYEAIVYKLKSKLKLYKNLVYFGFSKHNVKKRTMKHIMAAIGPHGHCPECEYVNLVKLHRTIISTLEHEGIDINEEYE